MSRFVSGGTIDNPVERDDEWLKAQQELEENRRRKEEEGRQNDGKSLYEVLQANKAAKQEAFEEATRLKNQFRALDDDEAEFLDSVLESTRAKEATIRKETLEQLNAFRKHQEAAEKAALAEESTISPTAEEKQWITSGRKRKKGKEKEPLIGVKLRKSSSTSEQIASTTPKGASAQSAAPSATKDTSNPANEATRARSQAALGKKINVEGVRTQDSTTTSPSTSPPPKPQPLALGLANYSSDEHD